VPTALVGPEKAGPEMKVDRQEHIAALETAIKKYWSLFSDCRFRKPSLAAREYMEAWHQTSEIDFDVLYDIVRTLMLRDRAKLDELRQEGQQ
jgi:hypothetical protein